MVETVVHAQLDRQCEKVECCSSLDLERKHVDRDIVCWSHLATWTTGSYVAAPVDGMAVVAAEVVHGMDGHSSATQCPRQIPFSAAEVGAM